MSNVTIGRSDISLLATRAVVAFIFLWHGVPKAVNPAMGMEKFTGFGLPPVLGPVVGVIESVAAALLIFGIFHRWASLTLAAVVAGALVTVQIPGGVSAGLERDLLILVVTLLLAQRGPGRVALSARFEPSYESPRASPAPVRRKRKVHT